MEIKNTSFPQTKSEKTTAMNEPNGNFLLTTKLSPVSFDVVGKFSDAVVFLDVSLSQSVAMPMSMLFCFRLIFDPAASALIFLKELLLASAGKMSSRVDFPYRNAKDISQISPKMKNIFKS